jgi:pilus assembly protein Flp/PilA
MGQIPEFRRRLEDVLNAFWAEETGVAGGAYALLLAVIGVGLAVAATTLGTAITNAVGNTSDGINAGTSCTPP